MKDGLTEHITRRAKLSYDPNNTTWSRSSTTYGQKILQSHGWTPGSFLGAKNTIRSGSPSTASPPQVKIVLKDNNLGLGAKGGANCVQGQCTGLDVFQGILGRLNGQNKPQVEMQGKCSEDRMKNVHQESRSRAVRFMSGGFLGGTRQEESTDDHMMEPTSVSKGSLLKGDDRVQQVQTQLQCEDKTRVHTELSYPPVRKETRKRRVRGNRAIANGSKFIGKKQYSCINPNDQSNHQEKSTSVVDSGPLDLRTAARRIDDKVQRHLKRRMKRKMEQAGLVEKRKALVDVPKGGFQEMQSPNPSPPVTVLHSVPRTHQSLEGRHGVRQRYIRHMKMAITDSRALNEVC